MKKKAFPTEVVLGCVSLSRMGNPLVHSEVMLPLIHFLTATPEDILRNNRSEFIAEAVTCGIGLVQQYPSLDKIDYPQGYNIKGLEAWLKKQYAVLGETMEIELFPSEFSLTEEQREHAAEVGRRWLNL